MAAAFLPSILVPIVGLVFPALSMALFFIYISIDDIELTLDFFKILILL
jgi:photosystem I subunit 8